MTPDKFKEWRKGLGWTQGEAATALGLSKTQVWNYENDKAVVPIAIELACEALVNRNEKSSSE